MLFVLPLTVCEHKGTVPGCAAIFKYYSDVWSHDPRAVEVIDKQTVWSGQCRKTAGGLPE